MSTAPPGRLKLSEIRALTKQSLGGRTGGLLTDAWYNDRINSAYSRLTTFQGVVMAPGMRRPQFRVLRFFELYRDDDRAIRTTDVASGNFIVPASPRPVVYVDNVYDVTHSRILRRKAIRYMHRLNPGQAGIPTQFAPAGRGTVGYLIHPVPTIDSHEIQVREHAYVYPDALVNDNDYPIIPAAWHAALWKGAASEGADLLDWTEKAAEMEQKFMMFIAERRSPVEEAGAAGGRRYFTVGGSL